MLYRFVSVFGLALLALPFVSPVSAADRDGFTPLFDGRTLAGWKAVAKPNKDGSAGDSSATWAVREGMLTCTGKPNGYLQTEKEHADYVLRVQWRFPVDGPPKRNTGVLLHVSGPNTYWPNSIEAQMLSGSAGDFFLNADANKQLPKFDIDPARFDAADPNKRHYFRIKTEQPVEKPFGEWNQYEITCRGGDITLVLNGVKVNKAKNSTLTKGRIALQSEGAEVQFKDIEIRSVK
ncbi:3-keto-disaccharide hydrolase [Fimbriiglobus ruber]|uniref:3-keto-alpha-glucoside-1,2-lyase/3-keto-2-hydroxy-glucal hydratase domain-containing protein n=1 Tax=Fimbriiglobus ruber TaxID=1908690 RepID=A0A225EFP8_9BACT|nr:DUF1080 domain-containing protein [Fimbriiglobus ruber]OWK47067.1 hypothetical protein FRUB_00766 [Fimbriiglobus ruber]